MRFLLLFVSLALVAGCGTQAPVAPETPTTPSPDKEPPLQHGPPPTKAFHATPTFSLEGEVAEAPRSVVIVSLHTVSAPILALYGGMAQTPNLRQLAQAGVRFSDPVTHFPETCLSHWTLMTGVLPEAHGNAPAHAGSRYTGPTLAEIARKHGYATGAVIGGVTLQDRACGLSRGFAHYDDQFPLDPKDMRRPAKEVTRRAVDWMGQQTQPFLLFVHYFDAHFPYTPPPPWDTRYDPDFQGTLDGSDAALRPLRDGLRTPTAAEVAHIKALYAGEVSALDADLSPLLRAIPDDVLVVVTADHGESFGHDYWFNHRGVLWDDVMRVPLLMRGLKGVPPGAVVDGTVGLVDVARTVLAAAGLPADRRMSGRDLGSVDPTSVPVAQAAITDPWAGASWLASRLDGDKVVVRPDAPAQRFQLETDPDELAPTTDGASELGEEARARWDAAIESWADAQVAAPVRDLSPEEASQLEALGYRDPTAPPVPHGKAPGRPPGHRHKASPPTPPQRQ